MSPDRKLFAVIPAAGHSRRMGESKLLLPLGGRSVIRRLLDVLDRPEVTARVIVLRRDDDALRAEIDAAGVTIVAPDPPPPDMRSSVEHALAAIRGSHAPSPEDGWLLVPADHPLLSPAVLERLIDAWRNSEAAILVPTCEGRRGHPTFFRWRLAGEVPAIPPNRGINELLKTHADDVEEISVEDRSILLDLDTPADYEAMRDAWRDADEG